jgi:hypothetical protein
MNLEMAKSICDARKLTLQEVWIWLEKHRTYYEGFCGKDGNILPVLSAEDFLTLFTSTKQGVMPKKGVNDESTKEGM